MDPMGYIICPLLIWKPRCIKSNLWSMREKTSAMAVEFEIMQQARMTLAKSPPGTTLDLRPWAQTIEYGLFYVCVCVLNYLQLNKKTIP